MHITALTIDNIYAASMKFLTPLDLDNTFKTVVSEISALVDSGAGSIFLYRQGKLERVYTNVPPEFQVKPRRLGNTYASFRTKKTIIVSRRSFLTSHPAFKNPTPNFMIYIPLTNRGKSIGTLVCQSARRTPFTSDETQVLQLYGAMASLAIRKAELYAEIETTLKTRDLFISIASHEIKTPLTAINLYIGMIKDYIERGKQPNLSWIHNLQGEVNRTSEIFQELLQIEQITKGEFNYNFNLHNIQAIIDQALVTFKLSHPEVATTFVTAPGAKNISLYVDHNKLIQALLNLLNNAAKFSVPKSRVRLKLRATHTHVIIDVIDHGIGISAKDLPKVFDGFFKVNTSQEGFGLGLYITKKIIEKHQGTITLTSKLGQGTAIKLTFNRQTKIKG